MKWMIVWFLKGEQAQLQWMVVWLLQGEQGHNQQQLVLGIRHQLAVEPYLIPLRLCT